MDRHALDYASVPRRRPLPWNVIIPALAAVLGAGLIGVGWSSYKPLPPAAAVIPPAPAAEAGELPQEALPFPEELAVVRVYVQTAGTGPDRTLFAAYPDGTVLWSNDRLGGGGPFVQRRIDPRGVSSLAATLGTIVKQRGGNARVNYSGPHQSVTIIRFTAGDGAKVEYRSWHELFEATGEWVVGPAGIHRRADQADADAAKVPHTPADSTYKAFRETWRQLRDAVNAAIDAAKAGTHSTEESEAATRARNLGAANELCVPGFPPAV